MSIEIPPVPPPPPRQGVLASLMQVFIVVAPLFFMLRIASMNVPPWAHEFIDAWGPVVPVVSLVVVGIWRYFPPSVVTNFVELQRQQVIAINLIAYKLREMTDAAGSLTEIQHHTVEILKNQAMFQERLRMFEDVILRMYDEKRNGPTS